MKDSYSFDIDDDGLQRSYDLHRGAYQRIFERLGMAYRIVAAISGAMGGSASEEFLAPAANGEDSFVSCASCGYAANTEAAEIEAPAEQDPAGHPPLRVVETPDTPTIESLVRAAADIGPAGTLKNLLLRNPDGTGEWSSGSPAIGSVDLERLEAAPGAGGGSAADVTTVAGLVKGYIGPQGLPDGPLRGRPPRRPGQRMGDRRQQGRPARGQRRHGP